MDYAKQYHQYGARVTRHDLLKTLAITAMIIDHIGHFFYPEQVALRLIGRISFPLFFFLIGYAFRSRIPWNLWLGAVLLLFAKWQLFDAILAFNILVTVILIRVLLPVLTEDTKTPTPLKYIILWGLAPFFGVLFDYGAIAFIFALLGYHKAHHLVHFNFYAAVMVGCYMLYQGFEHHFPMIYWPVYLLLMIGLWGIIISHKPCVYPKIRGVAAIGCKVMGRFALEIYVVHLLLFMVVAYAWS